MHFSIVFMIVLLTKSYVAEETTSTDDDVDKMAADWFAEFDKTATVLKHDTMWYTFMYYSNLNTANKDKKKQATTKKNEFIMDASNEAVDKFDISKIKDKSTLRLLDMLRLNLKPLTEQEADQLGIVSSNMKLKYGTAKICDFNDPRPHGECEKVWSYGTIKNLLITSTDPYLLSYVWSEFHKQSGGAMRDDFKQYVTLNNKAATNNGFSDYGEMLRYWYGMDDPDFRESVNKLWDQILPLYEQLHAYVRRHLQYEYNLSHAEPRIPAHLLKNMWGQDWSYLYPIVEPYKGFPGIDITLELQKQQYGPLQMFQLGEKFFKSIGLGDLPESFWNISILQKPLDGRSMYCHPSAYDFYNGKDAAIMMCTAVNQDDFGTIHHELGHIYYYKWYKDQPMLFKRGANPGFHEAVGDLIYLSASTPQYLQDMKLMPPVYYGYELEINDLMHKALDILAFMPFGYLIDSYRWDVFNGSIDSENLNSEFWKLKEKYQGVYSPTERTEDEFDAGAKYHVASDIPYIRYFVSRILMYQFQEALCRSFDKEVPLHKCSIYDQKSAGELLIKMMKLGSSTSWKTALKMVTGTEEMSALPFVEYFQPLMDWLKQVNDDYDECYGWGHKWENIEGLAEPRC